MSVKVRILLEDTATAALYYTAWLFVEARQTSRASCFWHTDHLFILR